MKRLSAFSVILVFVVLSVAGAAMLPLLSLQYTPTEKRSSLTVTAYWSGASAKLVESGVTQVLEGLASSVEGVGSVSSVSRKGSGTVTVEVKDKRQVERVRFALATLIRQTWDRMPVGVGFPVISGSAAGGEVKSVLTYTINADLPTGRIERYVQGSIIDELSVLPGVGSVVLSGATPLYREVAFDADRLRSCGLTPADLQQALSAALREADVVGTVDGIGVTLRYGVDADRLENIPVGNVEGHIVRLGDVASVTDRERTPERYYRINGLNTINLTVYPEKGVNTLAVCDAVKARMRELSASFPERFAATVTYDSSAYLRGEICKVLRRTLLSVIILLLFVLLTTRNLRYLAVVVAGLAANLLVSVIFYVLFGIEIHLWSMAGVTVSLGILIDTVIVMVAHYGYYRNRRVMLALLAAQLTTIGALSVIFLLPEGQRQGFTDFASVVMVNLAVSLPVALLLIPALVDALQMREHQKVRRLRTRRRTVRFNRRYRRYIAFARRWRWTTIVLVVLAFGLPFGQLPDTVMKDPLRRRLDRTLGGSIGLFLRHSRSNFYREVERPSLYIRASLPDGCTTAQLNEVVLSMENYLAQFDEIETFRTSVTSHSNASIVVEFRPEASRTSFPLQLKGRVMAKAADMGGASWSVYGINDQSFNNNVMAASYKGERIILSGYNYDDLYRFAWASAEQLARNPRVSEPDVYGEVGWGRTLASDEYYISYDSDALAVRGLSAVDAYDALRDQLWSARAGEYIAGGEVRAVDLVSDRRESFDVWNLRNEYIDIGGRPLRFSEIGSIERRHSGIDIHRRDHQYALTVAWDFIGNSHMARSVLDAEVARLNNEVLPVGYRAEKPEYVWDVGKDGNIRLLLLVVAIIYFVCAILFESLLLPLAVIGLIPVSFIGCFLIFAATGTAFDQGGYASLVMLAGLVVNAGIYIVQEWRQQDPARRSFIRAFNHKILPTLLTILSTALGLVPFLIDGPGEVFWYAFALGTIGGLSFSLIALVFLLPAWMPSRRQSTYTPLRRQLRIPKQDITM
ncbi:MAG: efflux RND transporter permease subunit [Bacteroidales bacterium]|nr:efflux RND transporter permease subunit [Bacteroidales bacterium]